MKRRNTWWPCVALGFGLSACASESEPPLRQPGEPIVSGTVEERTESMQAYVIEVDQEQRMLAVQDLEGNMVTLEVGPEVRNFDQIEVGDRISAEYREAVAFAVRRPGEAQPGVTESARVERAAPGEKPAAGAEETVTVTTTLESIEADRTAVTLREPNGDLLTVRVRDPENLENVQVGDRVQIEYSRAVAVSVDEIG